MIGKRTRAREIALQALFCEDVLHASSGGHTRANTAPGAVAQDVIEHAEADSEVKDFARRLSEGVLGNVAELDGHIAGAADNWDISRLAVVDRNVLRLAIYELKSCEDIPAKVSINEAIELGKRFSTAQSGGFVNGILDRIRKDLGLPAIDIEDDDLNAPPSDGDVTPTSFSPSGSDEGLG